MLSSGSRFSVPCSALSAQKAEPKTIWASVGPPCAFSVARMLSRISGICVAGSESSSTRLTKITTSRERMFAISRISAMSTVLSAWWADNTTTQMRLSRIARIVICSRIRKVSFTPGVSRMQSFIGNSGRCM